VTAWLGLTGAAVFYAGLSGGAPPVQRAAGTAVPRMLGVRFARPPDGLTVVGAVAGVLLLLPRLVVLDLSLRLSFLAVSGILVAARPLAALLPPRLPVTVRTGLAAGVAAELALLPVLGSAFGMVSPLGALLSVLLLPLV